MMHARSSANGYAKGEHCTTLGVQLVSPTSIFARRQRPVFLRPAYLDGPLRVVFEGLVVSLS